MHARVTTVQGDASQADAGIASFREGALPLVREADGFKGGLLMVDRSTGKGLAITLWDDEAAMEATETAVTDQRSQATAAMGAPDAQVDRYEVAVFEMP